MIVHRDGELRLMCDGCFGHVEVGNLLLEDAVVPDPFFHSVECRAKYTPPTVPDPGTLPEPEDPPA